MMVNYRLPIILLENHFTYDTTTTTKIYVKNRVDISQKPLSQPNSNPKQIWQSESFLNLISETVTDFFAALKL